MEIPDTRAYELKRGVYAIEVSVREASLPGFFLLKCNEREIGSGAVPARNNPQQTQRRALPGTQWHARDRDRYHELVTNWTPPPGFIESARTVHTWTFPFYQDQNGTVRLDFEVHASSLNDEIMRFSARTLTVESVSIREASLSSIALRIPDSLRHRPLVPVWGWMSMTSFDHPDNAVSTPAEIRSRAIDESAAWGATGFEFLPVNDDGLSFEPDTSTVGTASSPSPWPVSSDRTWTATAVRELLQHARSRGMANFLFLYTLYGLSVLRAGLDHEEREAFLSAILESLHAETLLAGVILEGWLPVEPSRVLPQLRDVAPDTALFVSVESGEQIDARDLEFSHDTYPYIAHWATFSVQHTGFDASYPHAPFPMSWYREIMGTPCFYMQGCAQTHHPRKRFPRIVPDCTIGVSNRTVSPDWIAAQIVSFSEMNLLHPEDMPAAAVCWEADEPTMAPDPARRYMYALTQDPCRACYACRLDDTGAGGEIDLKRETRRIRPDETVRLRPRHPYPATCTVLRNRFLELVLFPDRDYSVLRADLSGRGRYYHNGACTVLTDPVFVTRFGDLRELDKTIAIAEPAGPLAALLETVRLGGSGARCEEIRRWSVVAESSELKLQVNREWPARPGGRAGLVESFLGLRGRSMTVRESSDTRWSAVLTDASDSGLPDVSVGVSWDAAASAVNIQYEHDGILIQHEPSGEAETWTITVQYGLSSVPFEIGTASVETECTLVAAPAVLRAIDTPHTPVYVCHDGVWRARPTTRSFEHPSDVYMRLDDFAGEAVAIRREDYLFSWIRAGGGCRYIVDFAAVQVHPEHVAAEIFVQHTPAYLKTVRVESRFPLANVRINGKDWDVHEAGHVLRLPARTGSYRLQARR